MERMLERWIVLKPNEANYNVLESGAVLFWYADPNGSVVEQLDVRDWILTLH